MSGYKIEKDIPMPTRNRDKAKFPFETMRVGDSFLAPLEQRNTLNASSISYGIRHGMKFSLHKEGDGVRVWRVA